MNTSASLEKKNYIWIDTEVNNPENRKLQNDLKSSGITFQTFDKIEDGEDAIKALDLMDSLCLVVSGTQGKTLIPSIHDVKQVCVILVFCGKPEEHTAWTRKYSKIEKVTNEGKILKQLLIDFHQPKSNYGYNMYRNEDGQHLYRLNDLVMSGELKYTQHTMETIAEEIKEKFESDIDEKFDEFLDAVLRSIMYFLKRELNLKLFIDKLRTDFSSSQRDEKISQRYLVDMLLNRSSQYLHRRLLLLLNTRNPIPMTQPKPDSNSTENRFIPDVIHCWNFERPILLSFGIDEVQGKSTLLNELFKCSFDDSTDDKYFKQTIDLDFGNHFVGGRLINIADTHGIMSKDFLKKISLMFSGFLIHVDAASCSSNIDQIVEYLNLLGHDSCVTLIFRDVKRPHESVIKSFQTKFISSCPSLKMEFLPNASNPNHRDVKPIISKLRDFIFSQIDSCKIRPEMEIKNVFNSMLSVNEKTLLEEHRKFIDEIRPLLIDGGEENYPLYLKFKKMSQNKLEISKRDPYKRNFHDPKIFQLHLDSYRADQAFEEAQENGRSECGQVFEKFFALLKDSNSRLKKLSLLTKELEKKREKLGKTRKEKIFDHNLSIDVHWRNALLCLKNLNESDRKIVSSAYRDYILDGNPFEIIDGDNFHMQIEAIQAVFNLLPDKNIFVLTVVGPQNSGKSTLLNFLFGTSFEVRNERCTKGMYGTLVNVSHVRRKETQLALGYDYILVIDTEGILSAEKADDDEYSQRLLLFSLAVSHLVIINKSDQIDETMTKLIVLCTESLTYLETARVANPAVHIIMNKRKESNPEDAQKLMKLVINSLVQQNLKNIIDLKEENIHELSQGFSNNEVTINKSMYSTSSINETFVMKAQAIGRIIIDTSSEIIKQNADQFSVPSKWIQYSGQVFAAIKRHPDITKFKQVYERQEFNKLRNLGKDELKFPLSAEQGAMMIEENKTKTIDRIKDWFEEKRKILYAEFCERLDHHRETCRIEKENYERLKSLFQVQINNRIRSWEVTTILQHEQYKLDNMMETCENSIREKLKTLTLNDCPTDQVLARKYLLGQIQGLIPKIHETLNLKNIWENSKTIVSHLWILTDVDHLSTVSDLIEYSDFLESLDNSAVTPVKIESYVDRIFEHCLQSLPTIQTAFRKFEKNPSLIRKTDVTIPRKFLKQEQLKNIYDAVIVSPELTRARFLQGIHILFVDKFEKDYKSIVKEKDCLTIIKSEIKTIFRTKSVESPNGEFEFAEKIIKCVLDIITDFDKELGVFDFSLSVEFRRLIFKCIVLSTITYYYAGQKNYLLKFKKDFDMKLDTLIDRFLPLFIVNDNQDEVHAKTLMDYLVRKFLSTIKMQVETVINENVKSKKQLLEKRSIIKDLDKRATLKETESSWIIEYMSQPIKMILQEFDQRKTRLIEDSMRKAEVIQTNSLKAIKNAFTTIQEINDQLKKHGASRINFVNELFTAVDQNENEEKSLSNKREAMATIFNRYLCGQKDVEELKINNKVYKVNRTWSQIILAHEISADLKGVFGLIKDQWEHIQISYPGKFIETIIQSESSMTKSMGDELSDIIKEKCSKTLVIYREELERCKEVCPCCKRVCDFNHDKSTRIGSKNNEHQCELGHQIRGLGGIYFEITGEASLLRCNAISDEDIVNVENKRMTWKDFKMTKQDWLFPDRKSDILMNDMYTPIWERIGEQLCDHYSKQYKKQIKFVRVNSPKPINHFVFVLDHSGSMNDNDTAKSNSVLSMSLNSNSSNDSDSEQVLSPWHYLLRAVELFVDIRKYLLSKTDQITAIVFGNKAVTVFKQRSLDSVKIQELDLPMSICGGGTSFNAATDEILKVLDSLKQDPKIKQIQQTVIFMTDGEPQDYGLEYINRLSSRVANPMNSSSDEPSIHRFWTMKLGNFEGGILKHINDRMNGKFVNIQHANELTEAYAHVAEIVPTE